MKLVRTIINSKPVERFKRFLAVKTGIYCRLKVLSPSVSEFMRTSVLLNHFGVTKVLDIGGNSGQFAESIIDFGYEGKIVSFEPVDVAYKSLLKRANRYSSWSVAERAAIGNFNGKVEINVSDETVFSSIKNIKSDYVDNKAAATVVRKEEVSIYTLDTLKGKYYNNDEVLFLKVDTQGFEKEVLEGATELLKIVKGVKLEIPLDKSNEIYDDVEWDLKDYIDFFTVLGFKLHSIEQLGANKKTGIVHEADVIFFRE